MDSMQLVFDACYQPVWSRTQQALYKNNQVSRRVVPNAVKIHDMSLPASRRLRR